MRLSSEDTPVTVTGGSIRKATGSKVYLFNDVLAVVQVMQCYHCIIT